MEKTFIQCVQRISVAKNPEGVTAPNFTFIIYDIANIKTGYKIENISFGHDHVSEKIKAGSKLGFKNLVLTYFGGKSTTSLDFSIHSDRMFKVKKYKEQYENEFIKNSNGYKRRKECTKKTDNGLAMIESCKEWIYTKICLNG